MKRFAVIGFTNLNEFRDWGYEQVKDCKKYTIGRSFVFDEDNDIEYDCITCEADIQGRDFEKIIDVDRLRIALKDHSKPRVTGGDERDIFAKKVAEIIADYVETTERPCKVSGHSEDDDEMLYFTHNYAIGEMLFDKGLRFVEDKNGKD